MIDQKQKFRHEFKYMVSAAEESIINNRISSLLSLDKHAKVAGAYNIRSLYFDDIYNTCMLENENGTDPREKFRIRIYNHSSERITLECKRKERGKTLKTSCPLTLEQTEALMRGEPLRNISGLHPLLQKLTAKMLMNKFRPVIIVEYDRIPYVCKNGNVRITLDTNISSSSDVKSFLCDNIPKRPVLELGHNILEVKYDEYFPDYIYRSLQLQNLRHTAFSKYYICRKFTI